MWNFIMVIISLLSLRITCDIHLYCWRFETTHVAWCLLFYAFLFFFDSVAAPRTVRRQMVLTDCYRLYSLETILNIILSRELSIILNGFVAMHIIFREVWIRWVIFNFVTRGFRLILLIPLRWLTRWMLWEKTIFLFKSE